MKLLKNASQYRKIGSGGARECESKIRLIRIGNTSTDVIDKAQYKTDAHTIRDNGTTSKPAEYNS